MAILLAAAAATAENARVATDFSQNLSDKSALPGNFGRRVFDRWMCSAVLFLSPSYAARGGCGIIQFPDSSAPSACAFSLLSSGRSI